MQAHHNGAHVYRRASVGAMAEALWRADNLNLRSRVACRQCLGFAGWDDEAISKYLTHAMIAARRMREDETDRLARHQYD
jgi:hypothetical protein